MPVPRWGRSADPVVALLLASVVVLSVSTDPKLGPEPAVTVLSLGLTLPLAWRRRYPAAVAVSCTALYAVLNRVSTGPYPPDIAVVPAMFAVFTGAAHTQGRRALVVGVATFAAVEAAWVLTPDGHLDDFLPWIVWGGPFGAGLLTRRRDSAVLQLTARTRHLEEHRAAAEREAARAERDRIAHELHDVVSHAVSLMVVQAGAERLALAADGADPGRTTVALSRIEQAGRDALAELRAMLGVLRDPQEAAGGEPTDPQPRVEAVNDLVARLVEEGVDVDVEVSGTPPALNEALSLSAYRIVQEGLTNAVKHGTVGRIDVRLSYGAAALTIRITNPCAASPAAGEQGYGLVGARERAASMGGALHTERRDGRWIVDARLPYPPTAVEATP